MIFPSRIRDRHAYRWYVQELWHREVWDRFFRFVTLALPNPAEALGLAARVLERGSRRRSVAKASAMFLLRRPNPPLEGRDDWHKLAVPFRASPLSGKRAASPPAPVAEFSYPMIRHRTAADALDSLAGWYAALVPSSLDLSSSGDVQFRCVLYFNRGGVPRQPHGRFYLFRDHRHALLFLWLGHPTAKRPLRSAARHFGRRNHHGSRADAYGGGTADMDRLPGLWRWRRHRGFLRLYPHRGPCWPMVQTPSHNGATAGRPC